MGTGHSVRCQPWCRTLCAIPFRASVFNVPNIFQWFLGTCAQVVSAKGDRGECLHCETSLLSLFQRVLCVEYHPDGLCSTLCLCLWSTQSFPSWYWIIQAYGREFERSRNAHQWGTERPAVIGLRFHQFSLDLLCGPVFEVFMLWEWMMITRILEMLGC